MGALSCGWRIREGYQQRRHKTKTGKSDCNEVLRWLVRSGDTKRPARALCSALACCCFLCPAFSPQPPGHACQYDRKLMHTACLRVQTQVTEAGENPRPSALKELFSGSFRLSSLQRWIPSCIVNSWNHGLPSRCFSSCLLSFPFVPSAEYCSLLRVLGFRSPPMPRTQRFPLLTKVEAPSDIKYNTLYPSLLQPWYTVLYY